MDRRDESLRHQSGPGAPPVPALTGDVVPCPRCRLLAPVLPPPPNWTFPEARCARGHFTVLIPVVHERLRSLLGPAFS